MTFKNTPPAAMPVHVMVVHNVQEYTCCCHANAAMQQAALLHFNCNAVLNWQVS